MAKDLPRKTVFDNYKISIFPGRGEVENDRGEG